MAEAATLTKPIARPRARDPVADISPREPAREAARPGSLTFKHPVTGEILVRDPMPTSESPYAIPAHIVPEGMVYQWRRKSMLGEPDVANMSSLKRNGWREVPADRHADRPVEMEGLVLMECPATFVEQSRAEERAAALSEKRKQMRPRNEALRQGYFDDTVPNARGATFARRGLPEATDPTLRPTYQREVNIDG